MQITVKLRPNDASAGGEGFAGTAEALGVTLTPLHPGSTDPQLASYFTVEVPDESDVERVLNVLRSSTAVEAAYVKPADELA